MIEFEDADKRKIIADIDDIKIPFLHLNDLALSKFNPGRLKDKADVEELQKIHSGKGDTFMSTVIVFIVDVNPVL